MKPKNLFILWILTVLAAIIAFIYHTYTKSHRFITIKYPRDEYFNIDEDKIGI